MSIPVEGAAGGEFRALRIGTALAFVLGVCLPSVQAQLLPGSSLLAIAVLALACAWRWPRWALPAALVLGVAWGSYGGQRALAVRLDADRLGQPIAVSGRVLGLPQSDALAIRFDLAPDDASVERLGSGGRLRLSWYGQATPPLPGQGFVGTVKLRLPRGSQNPGGFDFERHALAAGLAASGSVQSGQWAETATARPLARVDRLRLKIGQQLAAALDYPGSADLLAALAVGDQRGIEDRQWEVLRQTGTSHLIAISGLHVGLVAGLGALLIGGLYRLVPKFALHLPRPLAAALAALIAALLYATLAGWSLPVQRTLVMIAVVLSSRLLRRTISGPHSLALAALTVLLFDPLAVLSAGFWLSFVGVAGLMWSLPGGTATSPWWLGFGRAQLAMSLGLLPLAIAWFGQGSVVGPLANLIAVPWITLVVVPVLLLSVLVSALSASAAGLGYQFAALLFKPCWWLLEQMAGWPGASIHFSEPGWLALLLGGIGAAWLFLPRAAPARALGGFLLLPLLWPRLPGVAEGDARISMIDVGQGLGVLVETRGHALLYDTGARFRSGFDFGEVAVVPGLYALGVRRLDRLVLSNQDDDHAGGAAAVLRAFPGTPVVNGIEADPAPRCERGESWDWDGVHFQFLHPPRYFPDLGNESSCVLRIQSAQGVALLTGDIGSTVEARLVREDPAALRADVIVVPHHGSRSSSSPALIAASQARVALLSRGDGNRYGHPHPDVRTRWQQSGARLLDSAESGFVSLRLNDLSDIYERRRQRARYWLVPLSEDR
ncbi:MAG: DNA internalization-related competence protein ComEC/Rec2 [Lysobacterales bacterium]